MQQAGTCEYCGEVVENLVTCDVCGAQVGPDHKKDYGCYVCQGRVSVDAEGDENDVDRPMDRR